ncbi:hypothetical protein ACIG0C_36235, partial [Kitasatospora aureofaciens]
MDRRGQTPRTSRTDDPTSAEHSRPPSPGEPRASRPRHLRHATHGSPLLAQPHSGKAANGRAVTTKHLFVTGGVASSLGKGLTASSLGALLKARGL